LTQVQDFFNALCPGQQASKWPASLCPTVPDIISVHAYSRTYTQFTKKVKQAYADFGRPVIVSEFAMCVSGVVSPPGGFN
jgi:hypothetical protein